MRASVSSLIRRLNPLSARCRGENHLDQRTEAFHAVEPRVDAASGVPVGQSTPVRTPRTAPTQGCLSEVSVPSWAD
jgi:hypothetical protein